MTCHLTARALEWLRRNGAHGAYTADVGVTACGGVYSRRYDCWSTVADVRAMVRGWKRAYDGFDHGGREPLRPSCPTCSVLLDEALEKFVLPEKPPPDTTEAEQMMSAFGLVVRAFDERK